MPDLSNVAAPNTAQLVLTYLAVGLHVVGVGVSFTGLRERAITLVCNVLGIVLALTALVWHAATRGSWVPLEHNFESMVSLAVMVGGMSLYLELRRTIGRVEWVLTPIVILFLLAAAIFGATAPHRYYGHGAWAWTHRISVFAGPIAMALATATGILYLVLRSRLRSKHSPVDARFGSLEKLERITYGAVSVGFALLTVGLITGIVRAVFEDSSLGERWYLAPKVILSFSAYVVYALVLHSPINPAFRGRRMAILSIAGFVLLLATIGVVQLI